MRSRITQLKRVNDPRRHRGRSARLPSLLAFLILLVIAAPAAAQLALLEMAPVNPDFSAYIERTSVRSAVSDQGFGLGYVPSPVDLTHLTGLSIFRRLQAALPSSYDLRTTGKLTAVRNQGGCGSCWAFAAYGSLESWLKPGATWDFSENNLKNWSGFDIPCCDGGDQIMTTAYLARWAGSVNESDDPYSQSSCTSPAGLPVQKHVQRVMFIPNRANALDNDNIKNAVMSYGALHTSFYYGDSHFNYSTASYYCSDGHVANHAVCIVGWDDAYPKTNFATQPPGNGAFIAKNSWGSSWGHAGYFYVSYYDVQFGKDNAMFTAESTSNYTRIYQYDPYGWVGSLGYGTTSAGFANVFTAASSEPLLSVSFYASRPSSTYTLKVYLDPTSGPVNPSGPVLTQSGTIDTPGYNTIVLESAVPLVSGHKFSVTIWLTTPGYFHPIAFQYPSAGYSSHATSHAGESYTSPNGTNWSDMTSFQPNSNVCLKAFTAAGPALSVTPDTDFNSAGTAGGPFTPPSKTYALTNTGTSMLNWNATHLVSAPWVTIAPTLGILNPGQSTSVTVSINSQANTLPAGGYDDTVMFTNATNGVGTTTRSVHLAIANVGAPAMVVTPLDGLFSSGPPGGPFTPVSLTYTVANTSDAAIDFSVTHSIGDNWVTVYHTLPAHLTTQVTALVNSLASNLSPGNYTDTMTFTNLTNGQGNTTRLIQLTVIGGQLSVVPADGFTTSGNQGGPFSPSEKQYTLSNTGAASVSWIASHDPGANWLTLSNTSGTLAPGTSTTLIASINAVATTLMGGVYTDTITFTNVTDGRGNTTRAVQLTVYNGQLQVTPSEGFTSNGAPGGPFTPNSKQYTLANPGNSSVNWSITHSPTVNWLDISQTSGTLAGGASTTVALTLNASAQSLPIGNHSDTVNFINTTNGVGSTTRAVTLGIASRALTSLDVVPSSLNCFSTDSRQLYATAYFSDSSSQDVASAAQWSSSSPSVATVSAAGVVKPIAQGSTTITCSYTYGGVTKIATCTVSVRYRSLYYLYLSPSSYMFYQASPVQFQCKAMTSGGWITVTDQCTWVSGDPSVATVDRRGVVTPLRNGSTAIRAGYLYNGVVKWIQGSVNVSAF